MLEKCLNKKCINWKKKTNHIFMFHVVAFRRNVLGSVLFISGKLFFCLSVFPRFEFPKELKEKRKDKPRSGDPR